jgi:hypothetical protein
MVNRRSASGAFVHAGILVITSAFIATAAFADGYSGPRGPYVEQPYIGWTGFYVGGNVGGAWSTVDWANINLTGERVNNDARGADARSHRHGNREVAVTLGVGVESSCMWRSSWPPVAAIFGDVPNVYLSPAEGGDAHRGDLRCRPNLGAGSRLR